MADHLKTLNDLQVIDYKVRSEKDFTVAFTKKFVDYYNINHDALKVGAIKNMMGAIEQFPEEFTHGKRPTEDQFISMFFSTVFLSYITDNGLISKIDLYNKELVGGLIATMEALQEMMTVAKEEEK